MRSLKPFLLLITFCGLTHADIYDNTGSPLNSGVSFGYDGPLWNSFSTDVAGGQLTALELVLEFGGPFDPPTPGVLEIQLNASTGSDPAIPGAVVATLGTLTDPSATSTPSVYDIALTSTPTLAPNTQYFIVLDNASSGAPSAAVWMRARDGSGIGVSGQYFGWADGLGTSLPSSYGPFEMSVAVSELSTAPEPGSGLAVAAILLLLPLFRRESKSHVRN